MKVYIVNSHIMGMTRFSDEIGIKAFGQISPITLTLSSLTFKLPSKCQRHRSLDYFLLL